MPHRLLVVEDDPQVLKFLLGYLHGKLGYFVVGVEDGEKAIDAAMKDAFDLVFLDVKLPGISGPETFTRLKRMLPDLEAVFITGLADFDKSESFLRFSLPPERVLKKPLVDLPGLTRLLIGILGPPKA